jgi:diacylglycerol kinase (ATP)
MLRALLVHNEEAGTDPVRRSAIEKVLNAADIYADYCAHGEDDLNAALRQPYDVIIAAGGDGTVADVVSELEDIEVPIAILPLGGSNNIANALDADGEWENLPARWARDRWVRLDRCEADGPWGRRRFVEALGSGVLTDAVEDADDEPDSPEEKRANGRAAFREALAEAQPFACEIKADQWSWSGECLMVEVMNIRHIGPRLVLAPGAPADDGLFDIVLIEPQDRERLLLWAEAPDEAPCPIRSRRAARLRMTVEERPFRVDDRSPNENLSGTVDIRIRASWVKILKPQVPR